MGLSLDQFLGHSASSGFGKGTYLTKWKKRPRPQVDTWLHTKALIEPLWRHGIPRLFEREDKDTGGKSVEVWSDSWICWEHESILMKQYHRDRDTGERVYPPVICPLCRLIEYVRDAVERGDMDWTTPLFHFEGDDPSKAIIINAGGMYNAFGKKDLSQKELQEMKRAKIYRTEAWRQNMMPKLSYVFSVVDNDEPEKGVQIALETSLLGDKVKEVVHKAMMEAEDEGNPLENPYVIRWLYRPNENFDKKYSAAKMGRIPLTDEIRHLIYETDPPNLGGLKARKDPKVLMTLLQSVVCKGAPKIPWMDIFGDAIQEWGKGEADSSTNFDPSEYEKEAPNTAKKGSSKATKKTSKAVPKKNEESPLCYECGEFLSPNGKCPNCGAVRPGIPEDDLPY